MPVQRAIDYAAYLAARSLLCALQTLSLETCERLAHLLGVLACDVLRIRRSVVDDNLRHAFPEMSAERRRALARQMWTHLFLMIAEIVHARRKIHATNWRDYITLYRADDLVRGMLDEQPTVLVTAHFGNFELAGYLLGMFGLPTVTVARPLDNPYLDRYLNQFRGATGQYMVSKHGSAGLIDQMLRRGASLTLLGDQAAGPKGCWVQFFGRPASAHKAIALFALGHNGPLLVTYGRRVGRALHYETGLWDLADPGAPGYKLDTVPLLTQWYSERLEALVRLSPEQYWWLHRRWKGAPPQRKRKKAA